MSSPQAAKAAEKAAKAAKAAAKAAAQKQQAEKAAKEGGQDKKASKKAEAEAKKVLLLRYCGTGAGLGTALPSLLWAVLCCCTGFGRRVAVAQW